MIFTVKSNKLHLRMYGKMTDVNLPENIYLFKVNKRNNRKKNKKSVQS